MENFADRLIRSVERKATPCIVGLDPRLELIPDFILTNAQKGSLNEAIASAITTFHTIILDSIQDLVPCVKPQIAFYEQYGLPGMIAFENTVKAAKERGLLVIVDAKRNDIGSTATAYANAFLGASVVFGERKPMFDVDAVTVNGYMGEETLVPFVNVCKDYGKGIFVLVKTSNPGSGDVQDQILEESKLPLYVKMARTVNRLGMDMVGKNGYSSVGAVVGATYSEAAKELRAEMYNNVFLVPGYGAQGASGKDVVHNFNSDGLGALINASRSITFAGYDKDVSMIEFESIIRQNTEDMVVDVRNSLNS
ncbi:MAG: orotidine-5'-phosphate decarboxylase [Flavobacteriales bacterium]|nr:orotidine-5'-phosphate decarboxylase [Flavobacteriales bacterium]